jgi:hypothetical protein
MPVARHTQTTLAAGEFDPLLGSREDVSFYYNSAAVIENVVPLPQGGGKRREGWKFKSFQRGAVSQVASGGFTFSQTNGGTVANLDDGDRATAFDTTTGIGTTAEYVVWSLDCVTAQRLTLVAIQALALVNLPGGVTQGTFKLQSSPDNAAWTDVGTDQVVGNIVQDRTWAVAPDSDLDTKRYWRLILSNPGGATDFSTATVTVGEVKLLSETGYTHASAALKDSNVFRLTSDISNEFMLWATVNCCDVFRGDTGAWVAAVYIPHLESEIPDVKVSANLDTLIMYHEDQPPFQIQRLTNDANWNGSAVPFDSVVEFPFATGNSVAGINEVQYFEFSSMTAGDDLVIEYNGEISSEIDWNASEATNATNLAAAIEGLADITDVTVTAVGTGLDADFTVEFVNADGEKPWALLVFDLLNGTGVITTSRKAIGRTPRDPLWSATRGYPRCGTFYQGRHWMGGFKASPDVLVGSRAGAPFDFKEDADPVAGSPIVVRINVDEQVTIQNLYTGRHLQIFTSSAELYVPDEPITVDNIAVKVTSRHGANEKTQPVDIQGGTLFVDRNGRALREYLFQDAEQSYSAEPISILAGHLLSSPNSMSLRRARDVDEPTLLLLANTGQDRNGNEVPPAFVVIDRAQQVTGFCRTSTEGTVERFFATQSGDAFAIVRRTLGGTVAADWLFLEQFDDEYLSDASHEFTHSQFDEFTATASQTLFTYTFTSPATDPDVAVWTRALATDDWARVSSADYTLDRGAKTVTFTVGLSAGTLVRINRRQATIDVSSAPGTYLDGVTVECHGDGGLPIGSNLVVSSNTVTLGDERWDFTAQVGLRMVPRIVLHPYKGRGEQSPTMQQQRIFRALLQLERTSAVAVGINGQTPKPVSLLNFDQGALDPTAEEILFSGAKRVSGIGKWEIEPKLEITQNTPGAFLLRAATYDVRF